MDKELKKISGKIVRRMEQRALDMGFFILKHDEKFADYEEDVYEILKDFRQQERERAGKIIEEMDLDSAHGALNFALKIKKVKQEALKKLNIDS